MKKPIRFHHRYLDRVETEAIYGERFLRLTYENPLGRLGVLPLVRRSLFSRWYGSRMNRPASAAKILPFVRKYDLDEDEFLEPADSYPTFNDFFYRRLKPDARPIAEGADTLVLPADGRHLGIAALDAHEGMYVKGQRFNTVGLLGSASLANQYRGGVAVVSRLCPVDYHRFHAPVAGRILEQTLINGSFYSVNPIALSRNVSYLWQNKRILTVIETEPYGMVSFLAIGATCVGSIRMTAKVDQTVERGDELGYFAFGGSCVVTIFQEGCLELAEDLQTHGAQRREVYARMGDVLGTAIS